MTSQRFGNGLSDKLIAPIFPFLRLLPIGGVVLSPLSVDFVKSVLKLRNRDISLLGLRICEDTYHIHRHFRQGTLRVPGRGAS